MGLRWNDIDKGKLKDSGKILSNASLSTINPTWTDLGLKPALLEPPEQWYGQIVTVGTILDFSCSARTSHTIHSVTTATMLDAHRKHTFVTKFKRM